jgi:hypothetical protein
MGTLATKYDTRQPSTRAKGPYNAIVYIDGTKIVAENSNGETISSGVAGTDDSTVINAASIFAGNGICKIIGDFVIDAPIETSGTLSGTRNKTTFTCGAIAFAIIADQHSKVENINITGDITDASLIVVDGDVSVKNTHIYDVASASGILIKINKGASSRGDVLLEDCVIEDIGGFGIFTEMIGGSTLDTYIIRRCKALNCGKVNPISPWIVGIDPLEVGSIDTIIVEDCVASGSCESGFYMEPSISSHGSARIVRFINCIADSNGQKAGFAYGNGFCLRADITGELNVDKCVASNNAGGGERIGGTIKSLKVDVTNISNDVFGMMLSNTALDGGQIDVISDNDYNPLYLFGSSLWKNTTFNFDIHNPRNYSVITHSITTSISKNCTFNIQIYNPVPGALNMIGYLYGAHNCKININYIALVDVKDGFGFYNLGDCNIFVNAKLAGAGSSFGCAMKYDGLGQVYPSWNTINCIHQGGRGVCLTRLRSPINVNRICATNSTYGLEVDSSNIVTGYALLNSQDIICEAVDTPIHVYTDGAIKYR